MLVCVYACMHVSARVHMSVRERSFCLLITAQSSMRNEELWIAVEYVTPPFELMTTMEKKIHTVNCH